MQAVNGVLAFLKGTDMIARICIAGKAQLNLA